MSIYEYTLFAYAVTAAISLLVVGIIVGVSKITGRNTNSEEDKEEM